jgi:uncharacterized protein (DUF1697 family)
MRSLVQFSATIFALPFGILEASMPTYIALLRAVNVGGTGKLPMATLRKMLEELGYRKVETYIQSGNAVFDASCSASSVAKALAAVLEKHMSAPVGVLIRTHAEFSKIIAANPFAGEAAADGARVHEGFLSTRPPKNAPEGLNRLITQYPARRDRWHLSGTSLYLHLPDGAGETKFTVKALERILGCAGTARNWNTVVKLHEMSRR